MKYKSTHIIPIDDLLDNLREFEENLDDHSFKRCGKDMHDSSEFFQLTLRRLIAHFVKNYYLTNVFNWPVKRSLQAMSRAVRDFEMMICCMEFSKESEMNMQILLFDLSHELVNRFIAYKVLEYIMTGELTRIRIKNGMLYFTHESEQDILEHDNRRYYEPYQRDSILHA